VLGELEENTKAKCKKIQAGIFIAKRGPCWGLLTTNTQGNPAELADRLSFPLTFPH
jgi:hypothetical protein